MFDLPWLYDRLPTLVRGLPDSGALQNASDLFGPRWVGITMGVLAPIYLPMLAWRERSWVRWLAAGAFLLVTLTLLLTQSLQGLIGLLAGALIVLVCVSRWFWLLVPVGLAALVGLLASIGLAKVGTLLLSMDNAAGIAVVLRLDMWSRAWAMIRDLHFTGIGLNTFPLIQSQFYPGIFIGPEAHSHNLYLQLALDLGLPGLFAFVWFVILWVVGVLRALAKEPASNARLLMVSALAGITAYLAHGIMDAQMPGAKPGFVIWSLLGIGAALTTPLN
jgi:putative inorganic carbon (hco3(-)) transporter